MARKQLTEEDTVDETTAADSTGTEFKRCY